MARKEEQQADTPKKPGRFAQIRQVFTASRKADPTIPWWMLLAFLAVIAVGVGIGALLGHWKYALFLSVPVGVLAATAIASGCLALLRRSTRSPCNSAAAIRRRSPRARGLARASAMTRSTSMSAARRTACRKAASAPV